MNRVAAVLALTLGALSLSACGNNQITGEATATPTRAPTSVATATSPAAPTPTSSPTATILPPAAMVLFSADAADGAANPFPSDRLRDASGHIQVDPSYFDPGLPLTAPFRGARDYITNISHQLNLLEGFSTFAPIRVRFDRPVVVDAGTNPRGIFLLEYNHLAAPPPAIRASVYGPDVSVEVQPVLPLQPKTTYALVVTSALTDTAGNHVRPSPTFVSVLFDHDIPPDLLALRSRILPVIDFVQGAYGISADQLALIDVFTTQPTTDDLVAIQGRLVSGELVPGAPVFQNSPIHGLDTGIFPEGTPQFQDLVGSAASTNISAVAIGSFDSYDFRGRANAPFDPNLVNGTMVPPVNHLDFYITIPKAPRPPAGYPIVIFGHGLGGSGRDVISVPRQIGDAPLMGIGISALQHGRRGIPTNFFVLNNIAATREFFRQTIADMMQLVRMIKNAHAAGTAPFDQVDTDHIMYFGVSLGGIMGTMFMAVEPDARVGMLSVPGGGLSNILDSHDIGNLLEPLVAVSVGIPRDDPVFPLFLHRFQQMSQWLEDPADPISYAPHILSSGAQLPGVPPKRILMHEGIIDNTVPNRTTDDLALAMRLPDLNAAEGCMDTSGCSGIWRFIMTDYGQAELSGHGVSFIIPQAQTQMAGFLASFGTQVSAVHP